MPLDQTIDFVRETLLLTLWLSLPVLSAALVIGLVIGGAGVVCVADAATLLHALEMRDATTVA